MKFCSKDKEYWKSFRGRSQLAALYWNNGPNCVLEILELLQIPASAQTKAALASLQDRWVMDRMRSQSPAGRAQKAQWKRDRSVLLAHQTAVAAKEQKSQHKPRRSMLDHSGSPKKQRKGKQKAARKAGKQQADGKEGKRKEAAAESEQAPLKQAGKKRKANELEVDSAAGPAPMEIAGGAAVSAEQASAQPPAKRAKSSRVTQAPKKLANSFAL